MNNPSKMTFQTRIQSVVTKNGSEMRSNNEQTITRNSGFIDKDLNHTTLTYDLNT